MKTIILAGGWGTRMGQLAELVPKPMVTIGEYALIGSGAVVTKDVPAYSLVVGNPGKIVGWVDKKGNQLEFDENSVSKCGRYRLIDNKLENL